ncbi:MAG: hypothetical protein FWE47_03375 [Oscillospiraceae bacterium]|nr:hypothetical protein [Oscillospiraceae bacterium]
MGKTTDKEFSVKELIKKGDRAASKRQHADHKERVLEQKGQAVNPKGGLTPA